MRAMAAAVCAIVFIGGLRVATARSTSPGGIEFIELPASSFAMGSADGDWDERPVHKVTLSKPLIISRSEITLGQYKLFRPGHVIQSGGRAAGVSWHDAVAFCKWLSAKENQTYRLPTEAEWEYACRIDGGPPPPVARAPGSRPRPYKTAKLARAEALRFTFNNWPCHVYSKRFDAGVIVLGGNDRGLTGSKSHYIPLIVPAANGCTIELEKLSTRKAPQLREAKVGAKVFIDRAYAITQLDAKLAGSPLVATANEDDYSANGRHLVIRASKPITLYLAFMTDGTRVLPQWMGDFKAHGAKAAAIPAVAAMRPAAPAATAKVVKPSAPAMQGMLDTTLEWCSDWHGEYRAGDQVDPVGPDGGMARVVRGGLLDNAGRLMRGKGGNFYWRPSNRGAMAPAFGAPNGANPSGLGHHRIGFRVVRASAPATRPYAADVPLFRRGVKQSTVAAAAKTGPDPGKPYFRKRYMLPTPPETGSSDAVRRAIGAAALHPSFRGHMHSPGMEVMPNGDVLLVIYTSWHEYEPGVSLMAARLRYGSDRWEMPSYGFDLVDVNDHAPMLWTDGGRTTLFWGCPRLAAGAFPFQWTATSDNGATWGAVRFPHFVTPVGSHSRQPINTAVRDKDGVVYISSDGSGGQSVLWVSDDGMRTWRDTGGRTHGRHTTFALLKDGKTILGMGGKNTHFGGYMPSSTSADGGKTWTKGVTPFCWQGYNQRPSLLRLRSGRLLFAGDFQCTKGNEPKAITQRGSYVALSDDEGKTWRIKKLPGGQRHEGGAMKDAATLGYSAARQAPNGVVHLIITMTRPCLHLEFNEAWILADAKTPDKDDVLMANTARTVRGVTTHRETYANGKPRLTWQGGVGDDGRYLLHGGEKWFYGDGTLQYDATHQLGRKVGRETLYRPDGSKQWQWEHKSDGTAVWTQLWPNGKMKAQSTWRNFHAQGPAGTWDRQGKLVAEVVFRDGKAAK